MRHCFLTFGFLIIFSASIYGQDNKVMYSKQVSNRTEKSNAILQKSNANLSVDFVEIDLEKLLIHEQFILQFGENNLVVNKERIDARGINSFTFLGKNENSSIIFFCTIR